MKPTRIAFLSSETAPFAKTGGLADVSSALPLFLHRAGYDVRPFIPFYSQVDRTLGDITPVEGIRDVALTIGAKPLTFSLYRTVFPATELALYLVDCPALYHRPTIYTDDPDEHLRYVLYSRAVLESCRRLQWSPEIVHCNDWQTGLVPLYLRTLYAKDPHLGPAKTILTIHNLAYAGVFGSAILRDTGLEAHAALLHQEDLRAGQISFLKTGIVYAHWLSTVSPTYAREIQTEEYGAGLHDLLRVRSDHLIGILNGVDYGEWSPESDPHIPEKYDAASLEKKERSKEVLLAEAGLPYTPGVPVVGIVSRLATQKGLELVNDPMREMLAAKDLRFVVLGAGERRYESLLKEMQRAFPGRVHFHTGFNNRLAHLIEAGSDMFLMPSRYEPCGLNQMYSMKYGTVPVVRRTGGLADTVQHFDPASGEGTGFVFEHFTVDGMRWALGEAFKVYAQPESWRRLQLNGMARDYSWDHQGTEYVDLYARVAAGS